MSERVWLQFLLAPKLRITGHSNLTEKGICLLQRGASYCFAGDKNERNVLQTMSYWPVTEHMSLAALPSLVWV